MPHTALDRIFRDIDRLLQMMRPKEQTLPTN